MSSIGIIGLGTTGPNEQIARVKESYISLLNEKDNKQPGVIDLAYHAASKACAQAGVNPQEIDVILGASLSITNFSPGTRQIAPRLSWGVHSLLKAENAYAYDIGAADFLCGIDCAAAQVASGKCRNVLVVNCDQFLPENIHQGKTVKHLMSGAGAAIIAKKEQGLQLIGSLHDIADLAENRIRLELIYADHPPFEPKAELCFDGPEECAMQMALTAEKVLVETCERAEVARDGIDHFILPRWSGSFRDELQQRLQLKNPPHPDPELDDGYMFTPAALLDLQRLSAHLLPNEIIAVLSYGFGCGVGCQLYQWKGEVNHAG